MQQRVDALTDTLTGLPNRRALYDSIDALEQDKTFQVSEISVLFFDLDHFKDVNDTFGHETGDCVLKLFAKTAAEYLKGRGTIACMGGEEFAAVLPGVEAAEATETAEAIRQSFAMSAAEVEGHNTGTTVSVGIASRACTPCDSSDLGALFRRADAALYVAKRSGRNRVEFAEPKGAPLPDVAVRASRRRKSPAAGRVVVNA
jgi:diguanylate cyclase (GGDEF)-like protein